MKKIRRLFSNKILIKTVLLLALLAPLATAASAGSAADPLVSQGWVDEYVEKQFAPLEKRIAELQRLLTQETGINITLTIGSPELQVNGVSQTMDVAPKIMGQGYTMVPVSFVAQTLGIGVEWLAETRQVYLTADGQEMLLTIGSTTAYINGAAYEMPYPAIIDNSLSQGRTLVHIRFVGEAFGCSLDWAPKNGATKYVYISR